MTSKISYTKALELSKNTPNQVMNLILRDPDIGDDAFRSIAMMAGATIDDIFEMDPTSEEARPRTKEELIKYMREQQTKQSGVRVTPLLGFVSAGAIAWYVRSTQLVSRKRSTSSTRKKKTPTAHAHGGYALNDAELKDVRQGVGQGVGFVFGVLPNVIQTPEVYYGGGACIILISGLSMLYHRMSPSLAQYEVRQMETDQQTKRLQLTKDSRTRLRQFELDIKQSAYKEKVQLDKENRIQLFQMQQQQSVLTKGYNLTKCLLKYKQQLKFVPLFASVVLAYGTLKSVAVNKQQNNVFDALFYTHAVQPTETAPAYSGNLERINANLHACFVQHQYSIKSKQKSPAQCKQMQKLTYCLITQNNKRWFQKNVHLHVSHFVLPNGQLRQSPSSIANTIVKNRKLYEYLFNVPMFLSDIGSKVAGMFTRKKKKTT